MVIHHLLPSFDAHAAPAPLAVDLAWLLRSARHPSLLWAARCAPRWQGLVRPLKTLRVAEGDVLLTHQVGAEVPVSDWFLHGGPKGVVLHSLGADDAATGSAAAARLRSLGPHSHLTLTFSNHAASLARAAGHPNVHALPAFLERSRWRPGGNRSVAGPASPVVASLRDEDRLPALLKLHQARQQVNPDATLALLAPVGQRPPRRLPAQVRWIAADTFEEQWKALSSALAFISFKEHDLVGRELLEAMAMEVPVLAFEGAAATEVLDGAGLVFGQQDFAFLAELLEVIRVDPRLRRRWLDRQGARVAQLDPEAAVRTLRSALTKAWPAPGVRERPRPPKTSRARTDARRHIAIVVQRHGEVGGGAELHADQIARRLAEAHDVTVLTTCARDHLSWENVEPPGPQQLAPGLRRVRFPVRTTRWMRGFNALSRLRFGKRTSRLEEEHWLHQQGPDVPALLSHLVEPGNGYDAFIFFTALYAPTSLGLPLVADRSILVPTVHDEPPLAFGVYADAFMRATAILANTPEEQELIARRFPGHAESQVVGVGVTSPEGVPERFRERHGVKGPFLLYVGRLEKGKGVEELVRHYQGVRRWTTRVPQLLFAGRGTLRPKGPGVRYLGPLSEEDKHDALAAAHAVVVPSRYESLSLVTLEAFAQGTPVMVNAQSDVLLGQVNRSGAGFGYSDAATFGLGLGLLTSQRDELSARAKAYAQGHTWERVMSAYRDALTTIWERTQEST